MKAIDQAAIETLGIPRMLLMDHAGLALAKAAITLQPPKPDLSLIFCGSGGNGGDGLSAARHLHAQGGSVRIVLACAASRLSGEPAVFHRIVQSLGIPVLECSLSSANTLAAWLQECSLIIDALLGMGLAGGLREPFRTLIEKINASGKPVICADVPSGLDGDTGSPLDLAVRSQLTVSFGLAKQGCLTPEGRTYAGNLIVDSITLPPQLLSGD